MLIPLLSFVAAVLAGAVATAIVLVVFGGLTVRRWTARPLPHGPHRHRANPYLALSAPTPAGQFMSAQTVRLPTNLIGG